MARLQGRFERGRVAARAGEEDVALHATGQAGRHRVLHGKVLVGVALESRAPDLAVGIRQQRADRALSHLVQFAIRSDRGSEFEVGVGEYAVH